MTIGENHLVRIDLLQSDGSTPLLVSSLVSYSVAIIQFGKVMAAYVGGTDAEIRQGETTSQIEIEITAELSAQLNIGKVYAKLTHQVTDADFDVDGFHRDIPAIEIFENKTIKQEAAG